MRLAGGKGKTRKTAQQAAQKKTKKKTKKKKKKKKKQERALPELGSSLWLWLPTLAASHQLRRCHRGAGRSEN